MQLKWNPFMLKYKYSIGHRNIHNSAQEDLVWKVKIYCQKKKEIKKKKIPRGEKNPTNILEQYRKSSEEQKK